MASNTLTVKRGDTFPPVEAVLESTIITGGGGSTTAPIDLTAAEKVKFLMKSGGLLVEGFCTYPLPKTGNVIYAWAPGDTSTIGTYKVEWQIHWTGGGIESVPNEHYDEIVIEENL